MLECMVYGANNKSLRVDGSCKFIMASHEVIVF